MKNKEKILIIEPHSDDSFLSAANYLNLQLGHGYVSREQRIAEYKEYVKYFDGEFISDNNIKCDLPLDFESKLDLFPRAQLVKNFEVILATVQPDTLMIMGPSFHHDHTIAYEALIAATRPTIKNGITKIILMANATYSHQPYSYPSPNIFSEMTSQELDWKSNLFKSLFPSQIRPNATALSIKGLRDWSHYRGVQAQMEYAEAFYLFLQKK